MGPDRLSRFSQRMAYATLVFLICMLLFNAACWLFPVLSVSEGYGVAFGVSNRMLSAHATEIASFPLWQLMISIALSSLPLLALASGMRHLYLLFKAYARRDYFSPAAGQHLAMLGRGIALWVLLDFVSEPLLSVWVTLRAPAGHHILSLSVGSPHAAALFLACCVIVIGNILSQASALQGELREFV
jgi:hypothetical protein